MPPTKSRSSKVVLSSPPTREELAALVLKSELSGKSKGLQGVTLDALEILGALGIPLHTSAPRALVRMANSLLAVADVRRSSDWHKAKMVGSGYSVRTREIIAFENTHLAEKISSGSYDDVRRKHLLLPVAANVIARTSPTSDHNDGTRGYCLSSEAAEAVRAFGTASWKKAAAGFVKRSGSLAKRLAAERELVMMPVSLAGGKVVKLTPGAHNELQIKVVNEFLPRFGFDAEVLYLGDAANKSLLYEKDRLQELNFFTLDSGELPDVVAYSKKKHWIFLIEAVHSFGPITQLRRDRLQAIAANCSAPIVYVTAFADRATFRKWATVLAWEQEVWIAESPDHMIHFNGDKFLGPHASKP